MTGAEPIRFETRAMGSPLRLTVVPEPGDEADEAAAYAWRAVVDEFSIVEQAMSRFRETSELTVLNRRAGRGRPMTVSRTLGRALASADRARRMTEGRFDPRVLDDLDRIGYAGASLGRAAAIGPRSDPTGRIARWDGRDRVAADRALDLGGIGKGLALRWTASRIAGTGVTNYLLEAGGDIVIRGRSPDGGPWHIGLEDPAGGSEPLAAILADGGAVVSSSVRVHRWTANGAVAHHLIDARTGEPARHGLQAVTVAGMDPAWSEVWSKALFVSGADRIADEARARGIAAWWVTDELRLEMTPAARARTAWVGSEL